jgi:hypothetical protein
MIIALHDAELEHFRKVKTFPNYALMKISAWHKAKGDTVEWWNPLFGAKYGKVYSSKVFDFTPDNPYLLKDAIRGGTGYKDIPLDSALPEVIDNMYPDYSIYPSCSYAAGYITRGCIRHCPWCVVPEKEGAIRPYRKWRDLLRPDSNNLVLMDNNILASDYGIGELESMIGSGIRIDINQGMDARLVTKDIAKLLSNLKWISYIRFSCDKKSQIESVMSAAEMLAERGIIPSRIMVYLLVTKDVDDAAHRTERLKTLKGISLYAQAERNGRLGIIPNKEQNEFCHRYIIGKCYRNETWGEYKARVSKFRKLDFLELNK